MKLIKSKCCIAAVDGWNEVDDDAEDGEIIFMSRTSGSAIRRNLLIRCVYAKFGHSLSDHA
jgi:hypothetical protein